MLFRSNAELITEEYKRIHDKITRAQQYASVEEAFSAAVDATEGAGLGLIIMVLMLGKIGAPNDSIRVTWKFLPECR